MRIAHIVSTFPPYAGGMGNAAFAQAKELAALGHEVAVFTPRYCGGKTKKKETIEGVKIFRLWPVFGFGNAAILPQLLWKLSGYNVIHLHFPFFGSSVLVGLRQIIAPRTAVILQYHMDVIGNGWRQPIFRWYLNWLSPRLFKKADAIVVSSFDYAFASGFRRLFRRLREKIFELPLGVYTETFKPTAADNDDLRAKCGIGKNEVIFLFVGGLDSAHYFKGVPILLEATRELIDRGQKNFQVIIVGDGNLRQGFETTAKKLGITEIVHFVGRVSDDDLPVWYAAAQVFILPSVDRSEAFGLVLLEAMSSRLAIITSDLPGVREVIDDGIDGFLVPPKDPSALAAKMEELLEDKTLRSMMGVAGRDKAKEHYQWPIIIEQLEHIYKRTLRHKLKRR